MADDTLEIIYPPGYENNPSACPKNTLPYESGVLLPNQQRKLNNLKVPTIRENQEYLSLHPEANAIVTLLLRAVFAKRPKNIPEFMGSFMARPEVVNEIKDYLYNELHTVVAKGADRPKRLESKRYHFINEDEEEKAKKEDEEEKRSSTELPEDDTLMPIPDFNKFHADQKEQRDNSLLITSISKKIHLGADSFRISNISGRELNKESSDVTMSSTSSLAGTIPDLDMHTLMSPKHEVPSRVDSVGTCSLLEKLDDVARSASGDDAGDLVIPFGQYTDDVGSPFGDQLNDEMLLLLAKRNLSGVSAISDQGVFKAVEVREVRHDSFPEEDSSETRRLTGVSEEKNASVEVKTRRLSPEILRLSVDKKKDDSRQGSLKEVDEEPEDT